MYSFSSLLIYNNYIPLMQPLILIAIVAVAAIGMSSGFLFGNTSFTLIAQDLGAKETDLVSPISTARVDFRVVTERITNNGFDSVNNQAYANVISACSFHSDDSIPRGGAIICKLTKNNNIVAEGRLNLLDTGYTGSTQTFIPIQHKAYPLSNDVQNINDVKIIVLGKNPTCDFITSGPDAGKLPTCT
jgi:hypothetical protein